LMARGEDSEELKGRAQEMGRWGMRVSEYKIHAPMAARSAVGLQQQVRNAGVCWKYSARQHCQYGVACRFKCYPNQKDNPTH